MVNSCCVSVIYQLVIGDNSFDIIIPVTASFFIRNPSVRNFVYVLNVCPLDLVCPIIVPFLAFAEVGVTFIVMPCLVPYTKRMAAGDPSIPIIFFSFSKNSCERTSCPVSSIRGSYPAWDEIGVVRT